MNPTGINVAVTKKGSMTKELFPTWCRHFVTNLPQGMGKGGQPVILIFDGHASHWNYAGMHYYRTMSTASASPGGTPPSGHSPTTAAQTRRSSRRSATRWRSSAPPTASCLGVNG